MKTSHLWWVAVAVAVSGLVLQGWGDVEADSPFQDPLGFVGTLLVALPLALALNITMRRRRDASGESSPRRVWSSGSSVSPSIAARYGVSSAAQSPKSRSTLRRRATRTRISGSSARTPSHERTRSRNGQ